MSNAAGILEDVWNPKNSTSTHARTLVDFLDRRGILAYGELSDPNRLLTDRDNQRVRILKFIASHPEGVPSTHITSFVCKGLKPDRCSFDSTSDPDHSFVRSFLSDLAGHTPQLIHITKPSGVLTATPRLPLLDLISEGSRETASNAGLTTDRAFCKQLLRNVRGSDMALSTAQKDTLAASLSRYIRRTDDYRLAFDVTLQGYRGTSAPRRMTKPYKTRFTDDGRVRKSFARMQQSLETGYDHGQTAVFSTLTCWPQLQDSLWSAIQEINPAFHNLTQYLKTDPSTKPDTRAPNVRSWTPAGRSTGRPREKLDYLKVLEFTSKGYPHLHVLWFDPPARESDGMPWLIDKPELNQKWEDYGMGKITDLYPLTYRDDLRPEGGRRDDEHNGLADLLPDSPETDSGGLDQFVRESVEITCTEWYRREHLNGARFNSTEGFVCWYQYGDHDHPAEWVQEKTRYHTRDGLIDMAGESDNPMQKTAGSYLGKYVSKTFGTLMDGESFAEKSHGEHDHTGDAPPWKLGLYWASQRQFWSISQGIRDRISRDTHLDGDERAAADWCTQDTVARLLVEDYDDRADLPDLDLDKASSQVHRILRNTVAKIDFLGAFPVWSLPTSTLTADPLEAVESVVHDDSENLDLASTGDRPPPVTQLY